MSVYSKQLLRLVKNNIPSRVLQFSFYK